MNEGYGRFGLVLVAWALPAINFALFMRMIYGLFVPDRLSSFWAIVLGLVLGLFSIILFFREAIEQPLEIIAISSVLLVMILVVTPVVQRAQENRHKKALKNQHAPSLSRSAK